MIAALLCVVLDCSNPAALAESPSSGRRTISHPCGPIRPGLSYPEGGTLTEPQATLSR